MRPVRCLIVDDERLARVALRKLLKDMPDVEIAGEADRTESAIAAALSLEPDVLLLDVQMPGGGGFRVLSELKEPPAVIFVTAHDQYALRAFEVNAVDYLLKPVARGRLAEAFERLRTRARTVEQDSLPGNELTSDDMVLIPLGASGHFRRVTELLAIKASGKYSVVLCADGNEYIVRQGIAEWERILPRTMFVRLTRGLLVNTVEIRAADFLSHAAVITLGEVMQTYELKRAGAARLRKVLREKSAR